jgi:hypothetical protein
MRRTSLKITIVTTLATLIPAASAFAHAPLNWSW